jgi:16S rRNA (guanine1516-N2)-methyltransferase
VAVGADDDADELLAPALAVAKKRVVVKRPRHAEHLAQQKPSLVYEGESSRFDVYLNLKPITLSAPSSHFLQFN